MQTSSTKLRSPARDKYLVAASPSRRSNASRADGALAFLGRSASTAPSSSAGAGKYGLLADDALGLGGATPASSSAAAGGGGAEELGKGGRKSMFMMTRGSSFRRQGSSGMTWADNWIFTDDGMFLGRHSKATASDHRGGAHDADKGHHHPTELQRSQSVGSVRPSSSSAAGAAAVSSASTNGKHHRAHHRGGGIWGFRWIKKNFRKAFR